MLEHLSRLLDWCRAFAPATAQGFAPGADGERIAAAEAASGVEWTPQLREFFATVGGGDVIPGYGLHSLDESMSEREALIDRRGRAALDAIAESNAADMARSLAVPLGIARTRPPAATPDPVNDGVSMGIRVGGDDPFHAAVILALRNRARAPGSGPDAQSEIVRQAAIEANLRAHSSATAEPRHPVVDNSAYAPGFVPIAGSDNYHLVVDLRDGDTHGHVRTWDNVTGADDDPRWRSLDDMFADLLRSVTTGERFFHFGPGVVDGTLTWRA